MGARGQVFDVPVVGCNEQRIIGPAHLLKNTSNEAIDTLKKA